MVSSDKSTNRSGETMREITFREAIREGQSQAMARDHRVFVMGLGVDDPKAIFGSTQGLWREFGRERVFDTPLAENAMTGVAIGAALTGMRPIMVHQRMDFMLVAMDQIANHAAKWHYTFGGKSCVPLVIRCIVGRGWGPGSQHSQALHATFMHIPGLKVVMPSTPYDAKGLLLASIEDYNPVVFVEHRWLYDHKGMVPEEPYTVPLGKAVVRREGKDATIVSLSHTMYEASRAAVSLEQEGIDVELVDLRTLVPMDDGAVINSVKKTGRLVVVDMGCKTGGAAAEIAARVAEKAFRYLRAPIARVCLPDTPTPTSNALERLYYPTPEKIISAVKAVISGDDEGQSSPADISTVPLDLAEKQFIGPF